MVSVVLFEREREFAVYMDQKADASRTNEMQGYLSTETQINRGLNQPVF